MVSHQGSFLWIVREDSGALIRTITGFPEFEYMEYVSGIGDVDSDGLEDLVITTSLDKCLIARSGASYKNPLIVDCGDQIFSRPIVGDCDGDGRPEVALLLGDSDYRKRIATFSVEKVPEVTTYTYLSNCIALALVDDADQDGTSDLMAAVRSDERVCTISLYSGVKQD